MIIEKAIVFLVKGQTYWIGEINQKTESQQDGSIPLPVGVKLFELTEVDKVYVSKHLN